MNITEYHRATNLRRQPPGRAAFAAKNVETVADRVGYPVLHRYTDRVVAAAQVFIELSTARAAQRDARGDGAAARLDKPIDTRVTLIHDTAKRFADDQPESPEGRAGQYIVRRYFGSGLRAVIKAPFEVQLALVEFIVQRLRTVDADKAEALNLGHHLDAIEGLLPAFRQALELEDKVTAADVAAAYEALQMRYLDLVFAIFTLVPRPEPRSALLGPVFDQDDRLAAIYAARRRGQSVASVDLDAEAEALLSEDLAADDAERAAEAEAEGLDVPAAPAIDAPGGDAAADADAVAGADAAPESDPPIRLNPLNVGERDG